MRKLTRILIAALALVVLAAPAFAAAVYRPYTLATFDQFKSSHPGAELLFGWSGTCTGCIVPVNVDPVTGGVYIYDISAATAAAATPFTMSTGAESKTVIPAPITVTVREVVTVFVGMTSTATGKVAIGSAGDLTAGKYRGCSGANPVVVWPDLWLAYAKWGTIYSGSTDGNVTAVTSVLYR